LEEEQGLDGVKYDEGKPRPGLLPPVALLEISRVLEYGSRKYSDDNWRKVPGRRKRYTDAMLRHVLAWMAGAAKDEETGLRSLAHAGCCLLYLLEMEMLGTSEEQDVPSEGTPSA
jgi:hypothetical protein